MQKRHGELTPLHSLAIENLRNITLIRLAQLSQYNILYGANGSGKSSILEAIHLLVLNRSFRATLGTPLLRLGSNQGRIKASITTSQKNGFEVEQLRKVNTVSHTYLNGDRVSISAMTNVLPLQLLDTQYILRFVSTPEVRRRFVDWGAFYMHEDFLAQWRAMMRCLRNINTLLRRHSNFTSQLSPWISGFVSHAEQIDKWRNQYIEALLSFIHKLLDQLLPQYDIACHYASGWSQEQSLSQAIDNCLDKALAKGFLSVGPQLGDLKITVNKTNMQAFLSRGQQKMLVTALKLAQAAWFASFTQNSCIFLFDDLPAELDKEHCHRLTMMLKDIPCQFLLAATHIESFSDQGLKTLSPTMFHVKHGEVLCD